MVITLAPPACRYLLLPGVLSEQEMQEQIDPINQMFMRREVSVPGKVGRCRPTLLHVLCAATVTGPPRPRHHAPCANAPPYAHVAACTACVI